MRFFEQKKTISHTFPEALPQKLVVRKYVPVKVKVADTVAVENNPVVVAADTAIVFKSIRFNKSNGDKANREINVIDGKDNHYHILIANNQITELQFNAQTIAEADFSQYQGLIKQIDAVIDGKKRAVPTQFTNNPNPIKKHRVDSGQTAAVTGLKKLWKPTRHTDSTVVTNSPKFKKHPRPIDISADQARVRGVIRELVNTKVVANASEVESFGLSETELYVNNQKQPEVLQRKLAEAYGIKPNYGLFYGTGQKGGIGIVLDKKDLEH
jgi:bla regulator protein BlaR1